MQKLVFILSCVVLLGWACDGKKKAEEASKLTAETATLAKAVEQVRNAQQTVEKKVADMGGIDNIPDSSRMKMMAKAKIRFERAVSKGDEIKHDMEQLASDYTAGKITDEAYQQQLKVLREAATKYQLQAERTVEEVEKAVQ